MHFKRKWPFPLFPIWLKDQWKRIPRGGTRSTWTLTRDRKKQRKKKEDTLLCTDCSFLSDKDNAICEGSCNVLDKGNDKDNAGKPIWTNKMTNERWFMKREQHCKHFSDGYLLISLSGTQRCLMQRATVECCWTETSAVHIVQSLS